MVISKILKAFKREKSLEEQMKEIRQLLNRRYGKSRFFTMGQIDAALGDYSLANNEFKPLIRAYFLSEKDYNEIKDAEGFDLDYAELRAETNELSSHISPAINGIDSDGFDGGMGDASGGGD